LKILVTGGTGFLGRSLIDFLLNHEYQISASVRRNIESSKNIEYFNLGNINFFTDWSSSLNGCEMIIHTAGLSHVNDDEPESDNLIRIANIQATENLAIQASKNKVKRFIFISSAKVNGEDSGAGYFSEDDEPNPQNLYSKSKLIAEQKLLNIAKKTGLEIIIIRPPLIYGKGSNNNLIKLIKIINRLPFFPYFSKKNSRSFLSIDNFNELILLCLKKELPKNSINQIYLVSDGESISSYELLKRIKQAYELRVILLPFPEFLSKLWIKLNYKYSFLFKFYSNFKISNSKVEKYFSWSPKSKMVNQLTKMRNDD